MQTKELTWQCDGIEMKEVMELEIEFGLLRLLLRAYVLLDWTPTRSATCSPNTA